MDRLATVVAALRRLMLPPMFIIEFRDGKASPRRGAPPAALVVEFAEAARELGVASGKIYGVRASYGLTLEFSSDIPQQAHQRFRNLLSIHRHRIKGG